MADAIDPKHLDKRTTERYLRNGQLDEAAYKQHIESLPDVADKSALVETLMQDEDFENDEDEDDEGDEDEGDETGETDE